MTDLKTVTKLLKDKDLVPALNPNGTPILTTDTEEETLDYLTVENFLEFLDTHGLSLDLDTLAIDLEPRIEVTEVTPPAPEE
jgi:hypothetical protein